MTRYFIGDARITTVNEVKDFGTSFDSRLTFDQHVTALQVKTKNMMLRANRFVREIHHPAIIAVQ